MPDIEVTCTVCGKKLKVSEVANFDLIKCPSCGSKLQKPAEPVFIQNVKQQRRFIPRTSLPVEDIPTEIKNSQTEIIWGRIEQSRIESKTKRKLPWSKQVIFSWILFFVIGIVMGYLRYGSSFAHNLKWFGKEYGWIILIAFWILIILKAFRDSVFAGICSLFPPYALYYLFFYCDDFYLRAVVAGTIIGIGQDSFFTIWKWSRMTIQAIHRWIEVMGNT